MPEFDCFMTQTEFTCFLGRVFDDGFVLYLNKNMVAPNYEYVTNKDAIIDLLNENQNAFLLERDDYSRHAIKLRAIERNGVKMWYPRAKESGPLIEVYFFSPSPKGDKKFVPRSLISYNPRIVNPTSKCEEPAGDRIKKAYNEIVSPLQKKCTRIRSEKRVAYVTPGAQGMLETGWSLTDPFGSQEKNSLRC